MKKVITISREFGSGGHDIGVKVAEKLGIPFYDHEIVDKAVEESGFTKEFVEEHGEYTTLSSVLLGTSAPFDSYYYVEDPQDKVFKVQRDIITKLAQEGPCVIVGRCADFILKKAGVDSFNVFIRSDLPKRAKNVENKVDLTGEALLKFLQKKDHKRRTYYRFYTKQKWGEYTNYNMMLDSGTIGKDKCVEYIVRAVEDL